MEKSKEQKDADERIATRLAQIDRLLEACMRDAEQNNTSFHLYPAKGMGGEYRTSHPWDDYPRTGFAWYPSSEERC